MPSLRAHIRRIRLLSALLASAVCASVIALPARLSSWLEPIAAAATAATTFVVTTNADSGPGSLRQAITDANANAGLDTIRFQIGTGAPLLTLSSALPTITDPVVIDGTTQPGYAGTPLIEIDGSHLSGSVSGLNITAGNSAVRALAIDGFAAAAIMLTTNGGNVVEGCYLGLNSTGGLRRGNGTGIILNSDHNVIGGTTAASRNVISFNNNDGIFSSSPALDNTIQGNYIGTDVTGSFALPNGVGGSAITGHGIAGGFRNSLIGGTAPGAGNLISGNRHDGIEISSGNTIQGNYIGTDATGMTGIANGGFGIRLGFSGASNNKIGGAEPGARNVISGNGNGGVSLESGVSGTIVRGNYIGVTADASAPLPNAPDIGVSGFGGIYIKSSSNNIIGGTGAGEGNVIAFSGGAPGFNGGVIVVSTNPTFDQQGNSIRGNSIFSNDGLGIDIGQSGVNPNDPGDADAGASAGQNFPILSSYSSDGTTTTVRGTLASKASTSYDLDFYSNRGCDPSGNGEGAQYVGSTSVTTDAAGNATFEATLPTPLPTGRALTATATAPSGSTSEFSPCDASRALGSVEFSFTRISAIEDVGALPVKVVRTGSVGTVTVNYASFDGTATAGNDYLPAQGSVTFAPGETEKTIALNVLNDSVLEASESLTLRLTSADGLEALGARSTITVELLDNSAVPVLSVNPSSVREGDAGTTNAAVPVTLSAATGRVVTVSYATAGGFSSPATPGVDYQNASGTLTFNPGETAKTVNVPVIGDTFDEPDETFRVVLSNATNAAIFVSTNPVFTTILDDDPIPSLSISDATVTEGTGGTTLATFNLALSAPSGRSITAQLSVTPGTATAGSDYFPPQPPIFVDFAPGTITRNFSVQVTPDSFAESDETFFVNIVFVQNTVIAKAQGVGTIIDDDSGSLPTAYIDDVTASDAGGATSAVFTVRLDSAPAQTATINYVTADGTATAGSDYQPASGTLTFAPGETTKTISVPVIPDSATEPDETFFINLSGASGVALGDAQGRGTITDGAATQPLTISVDDVKITEGNSGQKTVNFVLRLSRVPQSQVAINYSTSPGTASPGSDYSTSFGAVLFPPGGTGTSISVTVFGDTLDENDETFFLNLSNPTNGAVLADAQAKATILDDDPPPTLSALDAQSPEGTGGATTVLVNVALSAPSGKPVTFAYATADGTATAGADYVATSGTATIPAGSSSTSIPVSLVGDGANEPDETFFLNITSPGNATLDDAQARVLVVNDDTPRVQFSAAGYTFSEVASAAVLSVTRAGDASSAVSVDVRTIDDPRAIRCDDTTSAPGVAFARCDYATTVQTVTFAAGDSSPKSVNVPLVNDAHVEPNETMQIALSSPTNGATLAAPATTTLTITSDDAPGAPNPILSTDFFVRQQYLDFFGREPEAAGFSSWKGTLDNCPDPFNTNAASPSANCDRISVSTKFFRSKEFELKGRFVYNFYKVAFGRLPHYSEIIPDMASLTAVDDAGFFANKAQFTNSFVQRQEFKNLHDALTNAQFVDALMNPYGLASVTTVNPASPDDTSAPRVTLTRGDLVNRLNGTGGTLTRAQVLRAIADSNEVSAAEANSAFVAIQYFGYLRRDPEPGGYNDWLRTINANPADIRSMVNGFMNSAEYRLRFGQP